MLAIVIIGLFIAGTILAALDVIEVPGRRLTSWGVIAIGVGLLIWRVT